jgi:hypothetical protein
VARGGARRRGGPAPEPARPPGPVRRSADDRAHLLTDNACSFHGAHYDVEHPDFSFDGPAPALVAAVGGPRSSRLVPPLVDRVEVFHGGAVVGGDLDPTRFAELSLDGLRRLVDIVRDVAPDVAVGVGVFVAAGAPGSMPHFDAIAGDGLQGALIGEPAAVAGAVRSLATLDIDRVGLIPLTPDTAELLAPELLSVS